MKSIRNDEELNQLLGLLGVLGDRVKDVTKAVTQPSAKKAAAEEE